MSQYRGVGGRRAQSQAGTSEEARTPIAWQHRDNYHHQQGSYGDPRQQGYDPRQQGYDSRQQSYGDPRQQGYGDPRQQGYGDPRQQGYGDPRQQQGYDPRHRPESRRRGPGSVSDQTSHTDRSAREVAPPAAYRTRPPPDTEGSTTSSSDRSSDTKITIHDGHRGPALQLVPLAGGGPPTIRSAQSVPLLLGPAGPITWDGEPCPVHMHGPPIHGPPLSLPPPGPPRAASLYDLRAGTPHSVYAVAEPGMPPGPPLGALTLGRPPGSAMGRPVMPPGLLPPMMRPRPIVRAENGAARELPVRDPRKASLVPPGDPQQQQQQKPPVKCGGLKKVLLISLAVIVLGVILAVALFFITK